MLRHCRKHTGEQPNTMSAVDRASGVGASLLLVVVVVVVAGGGGIVVSDA